MILQFDEQVPLAEDVLQASGEGLGLDPVVGQQGLEYHPAEAAGGGDQTLAVTGEQLPIEPGLVVVALQERSRRQFEQVPIALGAFGQEGEVVVELLASGDVTSGVVDLSPAYGSFVSGLGRHVGLGPDDRVDARRPAGGVEVEDAVHVPVIGDPKSRLAVGHRRLDQLTDPGGSVQHGELGVGVKVCERPCDQRVGPSSSAVASDG